MQTVHRQAFPQVVNKPHRCCRVIHILDLRMATCVQIKTMIEELLYSRKIEVLKYIELKRENYLFCNA